jgi:hypothetical protein
LAFGGDNRAETLPVNLPATAMQNESFHKKTKLEKCNNPLILRVKLEAYQVDSDPRLQFQTSFGKGIANIIGKTASKIASNFVEDNTVDGLFGQTHEHYPLGSERALHADIKPILLFPSPEIFAFHC